MKNSKINISDEIFSLLGIGLFVAISITSAYFCALGAHEKFIVGQRHIFSMLLSVTFIFTITSRWWLNQYIDGIRSFRDYKLSPNQKFSVNMCSLLVALTISLPFLFVSNREQAFITAGVLLCITLLQYVTYCAGKIVDLNKIKYNTKLEFNGLSLICLFFISVTLTEYFNAQQLPAPIILAYFSFGVSLTATVISLCLWANCARKIYRQVTELPKLLRAL